MSLLDEAADELAERKGILRGEPEFDQDDDSDQERTTTVAGAKVPIETRASETTIGGESVTVEEPETHQTGGDTWLTKEGTYGHPRGWEAFEARQIVQTNAMQTIANGITDQLVGGELTAETEEELEPAAEDFWHLLHDVLEGPHLREDDLDDLITASVEDMLGPGQAYWQLLGASDDDLPVVSLLPLDPLTIRHNVNRHGYPIDPPYYQAHGAFTSDGMVGVQSLTPVPLQQSDLAVMHYPRGRRTHRFYPMSAALQVSDWLEILANSTRHHNRFYSDNEVPPGLLQILGASNQTVDGVQDSIQSAAGDPRSVEVIGGEGQAMWVEMGGTAVNLDVIGEQQWFFDLCLGALGLGKAELGLIEDVNRSNGEVEQSRIIKRVSGGFLKQFHGAFRHIAKQFDVYNELDRPFDVKLRYTDPREERAREERLRAMYRDGGLTLREYIRRRGDEDLADDDDRFTTEINGEVLEYGDDPLWLAREKVAAARGGSPEDTDPDPEDGGEDEGEDEDEGGVEDTLID